MNCCGICDRQLTEAPPDDQFWTMAPSKVQTIETNQSEKMPIPAAKEGGTVVPEWLKEEYFVDVLEENVEGFRRIQHFEAALTGGGGENYASIIVRVKVKVELEDGSSKNLAYMIKTIPQGEQGAMMVNMMGLFPKETAMYGQLLPEFEQMYRDVGKTVRFGPRFYEFKKNPGNEYVLLEDIGPSGYKNANRLEGLDEEHTLSVLKLVAAMHAASAVRYETGPKYDKQFVESIFSGKNREILDMMGRTFQTAFLESISPRPNTAKYVEKVKKIQEKMTDLLIEISQADLEDFNVIIHGDLWSNNIMFRYNEDGELQDTILIDFQMSRYSSPAEDLFYFLLSSTKLELKVSCFDKFVSFYHEQLVENLILLKYPKKIPSLRDLHLLLLKGGIWGYSSASGIMAAVLMNPSEDADIEKFVKEGEESHNFQKQMFNNPRYLKHVDVVMEWLDLRGLLEY